MIPFNYYLHLAQQRFFVSRVIDNFDANQRNFSDSNKLIAHIQPVAPGKQARRPLPLFNGFKVETVR